MEKQHNQDIPEAQETDGEPGNAKKTGQDQGQAKANVKRTLEEWATVQAEIADLKEQFLRASAETENVRRRAREELQKAHKFAIERFAEHLLPVIDSMEAALADTADNAAKMRDGVVLTLRQLNAALEKGRVVAISPEVGEKFDPHQHQAISTVPAEQTPNTIVAVLQKGYLIADRILRPALVTVCSPK